MTIGTRLSTRAIQEYVEQIGEGNYEIPPDPTLRALSTVVDDSFFRSYQQATQLMSQDPLIDRAVVHLYSKRTCGGFKPVNASLQTLTPFEQFYSVARFLEEHPNISSKPRTYTFENFTSIVPVWIKSPSKGSPSLWTTMLGTTSGRLKAPKYEQMAVEDPFQQQDQRGFIDPLTCLEIHRNPMHIGALAIKSSAYEARRIDHAWRYQNYNDTGEAYCTASAELKKQKSSSTRRIVAQAAGYNLSELLFGDEAKDDEYSLLPELNFEDFADEGYQDDSHPSVTPKKLIQALPAALRGDTDSLDELTRKILAVRLGKSRIPSVNEHVIKILFPEDK